MKLFSLASLGVLCLLFGAGCGGDSGKDSEASVTSPPHSSTLSAAPSSRRDPATAVDTGSLGPQFGVFRGSRGARDELPGGMILAPVAAGLGLDLAASRYSRDFDGRPAYLVPGRDFVCLYSFNEAVGSCWKPAIIRRGLAIASALCGPGLDSGHVATFGLVPDGVSEVTIVRTNVPSVTVPVEGNVFVGLSSSETPLPMQVAWEERGRRVVRSSGIPPAVAREGCGASRRAS